MTWDHLWPLVQATFRPWQGQVRQLSAMESNAECAIADIWPDGFCTLNVSKQPLGLL